MTQKFPNAGNDSEKGLLIRPVAGKSASVSLHPLSNESGLIVKVTPPKEPKDQSTSHVPCDIVLVIDVSGSMGCSAPVPANPGDKKEDYGLSVLDLVKHAARTIVSTLDEGDRLGIVTFSSAARVVQQLIPMTAGKKSETHVNIDSMRPSGATNLWHGILEGLKLFNDKRHTGRVPAIMVLTDGQPNHLCPAQGYVPKLRGMEQLPAAIHTFGFGFSLRSGLLKSIAEIGSGNYAFIPDAGMIGTVFVHAVANLQSTFANQATLKLTYPSYLALKETCGDSVEKQEPADLVDEGDMKQLTIPLGNIQYGQSRDIFLSHEGTTQLREALNGKGVPPPGVTAVLQYHRMTPELHRTAAYRSMLNFADPLPDADVAYHISRSRLISFISSLFPIRADGEHQAPIPFVPETPNWLAELIATIPAAAYPTDPRNRSLLEDLTGADPHGQVTLALSKPDYFRRWGVHYLPSLAGAHARQICNSFKDPGPLQYGVDSPLFDACRARLDAAFDALPPPKPSNVTHTSAPVSNTTMRSYNRSSNPCFAGCVPVELAGEGEEKGKRVPLSALRGGMHVATPCGAREVLAVLKTRVRRERMCLVGAGLVVTPWHPVSLDGGRTWVFPAAVARRAVRYTGAIYSVLLRQDGDPAAHAVCVGDGMWGVTLGHGVVAAANEATLDVRAHRFFGDWNAVAASLARLKGSGKTGVVLGGGVKRDQHTGLICGFNRPAAGRMVSKARFA